MLDESDLQHKSPDKKRPSSQPHKKDKPSPAIKKGSTSDRWAGGSLKRRRKTNKTLPDGDPEDWKSDDSDWICTDDEEFSSDNETHKKAKKSCK